MTSVPELPEDSEESNPWGPGPDEIKRRRRRIGGIVLSLGTSGLAAGGYMVVSLMEKIEKYETATSGDLYPWAGLAALGLIGTIIGLALLARA